MSIQYFTDADGERCILVDSVTERALPVPAFDSLEDAESFVDWVRAVHGLHVAAIGSDSLAWLLHAWMQQPQCLDCRRVLDDAGRCDDCECDLDNVVGR